MDRHLRVEHGLYFLEDKGFKEFSDFIGATQFSGKARARTMRRRLIAGAMRCLNLVDDFLQFIERLDPHVSDLEGHFKKYLQDIDTKSFKDPMPKYIMRLRELCEKHKRDQR